MWLWPKLFGESTPAWHVAVVGLGVAVVLAAICAEILTAIVRRSLARSAARGDASRAHAQATARIVRFGAFVLLTLVFLTPVLEFLGLRLRAGMKLHVLKEWLSTSGLKVLLIGVLAYVLIRVIGLATSQFERHLGSDSPMSSELAKRARTLGDIVRNVVTAIITAIAIVYILSLLGFDILPLLTTAGIAGLAIGFGAQTLVKDIISGFFLILDDQVRVGDTAEINGVHGLVEALHLRTLVLRDARGALHFFPTGSITTLANLSKDFSYALLDVHVRHSADLDRTLELLQRLGDELRADPQFGKLTMGPIEVLGADNQGADAIIVRIRLKTLPMRQWDVARELRRRIRQEVGYKGIDIPIVQPMAGTKKLS